MKGKIIHNAKAAIEAQKGTGGWLHRNIDFNHGLRLNAMGRGAATQLFDSLYQGESLYKREQKRLDLEILIANLVRARDRAVSISLDHNIWKINRYKRASYFIIELVKVMETKGYLRMKLGYQFERESRKTRIWATEKLLEYIRELNSAVIYSPKELIILRDENGKLKEYRDTAETRRIRKILQRANEVNCKADIWFSKWKLNPCLLAIFKEKFTLYGRLHTKGHRHHYQSLNEDERAEITINGESVVELDYSGLHPHLLYAKEKIQFNGDPYTMIDERANNQNKDLRRFYKKALLSLINARDKWVEPHTTRTGQKRRGYWSTAKTNAVSSINSLMNLDFFLPQEKSKKGLQITEKDQEKMNQAKQARKYLQLGGFIKAHDIIDAFSEAHPKIAHHFYTGETGMRLMNLDAKIALEVIKHFVKQDKPILDVHDSFIVQAQYRDELFQVMQKVYQQKTGGFSIPIK